VSFIFTFGVFLLAGYLLDWRFGTIPGFLLLGGCIGFGLGLHRLIRQAKQLRQDVDAEEPPNPERP